MNSRYKIYLREETGTTAVEFALVATAFLTLIFGIFEAGRLFMTLNALQYAVEEATRYNIAHEDVSIEELEQIVLDSMSEMLISTDNVELDGPDYSVVSGVNFVQISVTYSFEPMMLPLLPDNWAKMDLTASSRMPVR